MENNPINKLIISLHGVPMGTIAFSVDGITLYDCTDEELSTLVAQVGEEGVPYMEHGNKSSMVIGALLSGHPLFIPEFISFIKEKGYELYEEVLKLQETLYALLDCLDNEENLKLKIKTEFPNMTYLEKTFIIGKLEKKFDEFFAATVEK